MSSFVLAAQAGRDLAEILTYLEERNIAASMRFETELLSEFRSLAAFPLRYRVREEFAEAPIRVHIFKDYLIFYDPEESPLLILRVIHGKRNVAAVMKGLEQSHE